MSARLAIAAIVAAAVMAGGAGLAAKKGPDAVAVRANMVEGVNPAALAIWDVGNAALNDENGLDPAQMNDAAWLKIQEAAESLRTYAHRLATAKVIRASGPDLVGGKVPEGVSSREQIQAMIDADPAGFRASATKLEQDADALAKAAKARDIKATGELVFTFDTSCQSCHENYWYQKQ
jgi:cytochrome c556